MNISLPLHRTNTRQIVGRRRNTRAFVIVQISFLPNPLVRRIVLGSVSSNATLLNRKGFSDCSSLNVEHTVWAPVAKVPTDMPHRRTIPMEENMESYRYRQFSRIVNNGEWEAGARSREHSQHKSSMLADDRPPRITRPNRKPLFPHEIHPPTTLQERCFPILGPSIRSSTIILLYFS